MKPELLKYLSSQKSCVVSLEMPDGSPHASTVHFLHMNDPFQFVFLTEKGYRKGEALLSKNVVRASVVVGTQEESMKTFQLDGTATLTGDESLIDAYYAKFTEKDKKNLSENDVFFVFTPTWWRFTDWTLPEGKTVFNSDGTIVAIQK